MFRVNSTKLYTQPKFYPLTLGIKIEVIDMVYKRGRPVSSYISYRSMAALAISSQNWALGISFRDVMVNWRRSVDEEVESSRVMQKG
jgi:hypothetical protein